MKISDWLDEKEAGAQMYRNGIPKEMSYDEGALQMKLFISKQDRVRLLCTENHALFYGEHFGHWCYCRGQDKKAGIHSSEIRSGLFTKDKDVRIPNCETHIK